VKGPASYFPSIENKYGKKIEHWLNLVGKLDGNETHGNGCLAEVRTWLGSRARKCDSCARARIKGQMKSAKSSQTPVIGLTLSLKPIGFGKARWLRIAQYHVALLGSAPAT